MNIKYKDTIFELNKEKIDSKFLKVFLSGNEYLIEIEEIYDYFINHIKYSFCKFKWNQQYFTGIITEYSQHYYITINGQNYILEKIHKNKEYSTQIELSINEIFSPMSGKITKIFVKEEDTVKQGDILIIIESMKMENQILSPRTAKIEKIYVKEGENIETNQLLIKLK